MTQVSPFRPVRKVRVDAQQGNNIAMKSPSFQFYPRDWLGSQRVQMMTLEEEGVYIRLLCFCWTHGSIPADPEMANRNGPFEDEERPRSASIRPRPQICHPWVTPSAWIISYWPASTSARLQEKAPVGNETTENDS